MRISRAVTLLLSTLAAATPSLSQPISTHPRLLIRTTDLPRLRGWATPSNPVYRDGLAALSARAKSDMDAGIVPNRDTAGDTYADYPTEMYAELFAFQSLINPDQAAREDFAQRARTLLMYVINRAALGPAEGEPFRGPEFSTNDRSRWQGESFALTVDWIYPSLSTEDKAIIRRVFLRWINENLTASITGHDHPEPVGVVNDPALVADRSQVRWASNNYFIAHMRNIGLMSMCLDEADDSGGALGAFLRNATGAWLYLVDYLMRNDGSGGLGAEGFEYSPQSLAYAAQFLLALKTAGRDDPAVYGPQVVLAGNSFWEEVVPAYLHSLSPASVPNEDFGQVYQPAWYGDGLNYLAGDPIGLFGTLGVYDQIAGNNARLQALRWIQTNLAPGGPSELTRRARDENFFLNPILYFLLFDPGAAPPQDPRPALPLNHFAPGLGRLLARTGWTADASWFTYKLSWNVIDHQNGDGNQFEFYRRGEWLTKERTGYDLDYGGSHNHNTLTLENGPPDHNDPDQYRNVQWRLGSQWTYVSSGDPSILARSCGPQFCYVAGDATALYNSTREGSTSITHASRSILWQAPDHIIVYDRASSQAAGRFKHFWLNLPNPAAVTGNRSVMTTKGGQQLFVSTLAPGNALVTSEPSVELGGDVANYEPMRFRLRVEAPGGPQTVRFLHVLQGADPGAAADPAQLVQSTGGTPFEGAVVNNTVTLFPVTVNAPFSGLTYRVPAGTRTHRITGLAPNAGYGVAIAAAGDSLMVTIMPEGATPTDAGGVLVIAAGL